MGKSNNKKSFSKLKKFFFLLSVIILVASVWLGQRFLECPTQIIPFPYQTTVTDFPQQDLAKMASVLIVGDRMAKSLDSFQNDYLSKSSRNLKSPLPIFNWGQDHENLARTLAKLKSLTKTPSLVIYHGGSEEFFEKRFEVKDIKKILRNFDKRDNPKLISLIITFPPLSRFIYEPVERLIYKPEAEKDATVYTAEERQTQFELTFKLYEEELQEMINWAKEKNVQLLFVSTPVNLEITPRLDCSNTTSENLKTYQEELRDRISKDELKGPQAELNELTHKIIGNALNFHLLGQTYLKMGQLAKAKEELIKGAAYDCEPWRINPVFNVILEKTARQNAIPFVDFDRLVNKNLGQNATFITEIYPQNIYYQQLMEELASKTITLLHL